MTVSTYNYFQQSQLQNLLHSSNLTITTNHKVEETRSHHSSFPKFIRDMECRFSFTNFFYNSLFSFYLLWRWGKGGEEKWAESKYVKNWGSCNSQGYQSQCKWVSDHLSANLLVILEVHNQMQDRGSKIPPHQPLVPNLEKWNYINNSCNFLKKECMLCIW